MTTPGQPTRLGALIFAYRDERGLSQLEFSEKVDMSQGWVASVENGRIKTPRIEVLHRVADVLGIPVADVFIAANLADTTTEATRVVTTFPVDQSSTEDALRKIYPELNDDRIASLAETARGLLRLQRRESRKQRIAEDGGPREGKVRVGT